ncbi:uncharacterized protein LOC141908954 [Tubulanus polymorphus]|uniref:uncharacterized protein LOC141908954 n=1 Tax=Tubulanus polymorphus TaxID=672921 RepID=UPI003DA3435A
MKFLIQLIIILHMILLLAGTSSGTSSRRCRKPRVRGGRTRVKNAGRLVYFHCRRNLKRIGAAVAVCMDGNWSKPPPICAGTGCPPVLPSPGLEATGFGGYLTKFSCKGNGQLKGSAVIYCNTRKWNATIPQCVASSKEECNFDDDTCGWVQDSTDDFDWSVNTGPTSTDNTGPTADHTKGLRRNGRYLYAESSFPRRDGQKTRLLSPIYEANVSGQCFEFWYYMYGQVGMGELNVYLKTSGSSNMDSRFTKRGNQGRVWNRAEIAIEPLRRSFQIVFEAVRGTTKFTDIAIDDVQLKPCPGLNISKSHVLSNGSDVEFESSGDISVDGVSTTINTTTVEQTMTTMVVRPTSVTSEQKSYTTTSISDVDLVNMTTSQNIELSASSTSQNSDVLNFTEQIHKKLESSTSQIVSSTTVTVKTSESADIHRQVIASMDRRNNIIIYSSAGAVGFVGIIIVVLLIVLWRRHGSFRVRKGSVSSTDDTSPITRDHIFHRMVIHESPKSSPEGHHYQNEYN